MQGTEQKKSLAQKNWTLFKWGGFLGCVALVLAGIATLILYSVYRDDIPKVLEVKDYRPSLKSQVYAETGELIAEFGSETRILVEKNKMPKRVAQAFVASEDKNFFRHHGIDFVGIFNALFQSITLQRSTLRGASTITQQLAKSLLIKEEGFEQATARTISRKIKEAILARKLEMNLSKADIIWMYLNEVYLGHGAYGVAAAAQNYFRSELKKLSLAQIALIAGLPQAPSRFSPQNNMPAALARQRYVLGRMHEDGYISAEEKAQALKDNMQIKIYERMNRFRELAPYFSEQVRRMLIEKFGEKTLYEEGLKIYTTLDIERQQIMQNTLAQGLLEVDKRQGFLGPVFRPQNNLEKQKAKELVKNINLNDLFGLGETYSLAQVEGVDLTHQTFVVNTQKERGLLPLAAMNWAREPNPSNNFGWHKLRGIKDVLVKGDVILVRKISRKELQILGQGAFYQPALGSTLKFYATKIRDDNFQFFALEQEPKVEGAMLAVEPRSGYVQAINGGYSFDRSEFNRVNQACRQPGSVFKPVVYSAAIALEKYTPATMVLDTPLTFRDSSNESSWKPKNFGQKYKGEVTVREAVMRSMNVPTLNVMASVGAQRVLDWAKTLGVESNLKLELGTGIGSSCITPLELSRVFSVMANQGEYIEPKFVKRIVDRDGNEIAFDAKANDSWIAREKRIDLILEENLSKKNRVMNEEDAFTMHYLLTQAAQFGTAQRTKYIGRPVAGKTGTTNDSFDTWFAGYTKNLLGVVWVGYDQMDVPLGVYEQGARTALPFFNEFAIRALKKLPKEEWEKPSSMCEARIDLQTGLRLENDHPMSFLAPFKCGNEPPLKENVVQEQNIEQALDLVSNF